MNPWAVRFNVAFSARLPDRQCTTMGAVLSVGRESSGIVDVFMSNGADNAPTILEKTPSMASSEVGFLMSTHECAVVEGCSEAQSRQPRSSLTCLTGIFERAVPSRVRWKRTPCLSR